MFLNVINWAEVFTAIANIILVSIPEEIFLVMFTLILLRQFDFLESKKEGEGKFKKRDIFEISIPVLCVALITTILRYCKIDPNYILFSSVLILFICVVIVFKQWTIIGMAKTFFASLISCFTLILIEFTYVPLLYYVIHRTYTDFNNSTLLNFIIAIPERIIEYSLVAFFLIRKATFLKANFFKTIVSSKTLTIIAICIIVFNMVAFSAIGKLIWFDRILINYSLSIQVIMVVTVFLFPILNITAFLAAIYYIRNKEMYRSFLTKEIMNRLTEDLWSYTNNRDFDKIELTLKDMDANIHDIYTENIIERM